MIQASTKFLDCSWYGDLLECDVTAMEFTCAWANLLQPQTIEGALEVWWTAWSIVASSEALVSYEVP